MKLSKIFSILALFVILSLLTVFIPATPALAYDRDIDVSPTKGKIGATIDITGSDWPPSISNNTTTEKHVKIYFAKDEANTGDSIDDEVDTYELMKTPSVGFEDESDEGEFDTSFKVPTRLTDGSDDEDVEPGDYYIYVTDSGSKTIRATADFTVIGSGAITIAPKTGLVGTEVEINGKDFSDNEAITIKYDATTVNIESGDAETDSSGVFEGTTIIVPKSAAGSHTITVIGEDSGAEVKATFIVEPQIAISPTSGTAQTPVTLSGTGFGSKSDVVVALGTTEVASETSDRVGTFEVTFNVPAVTPGAYSVEAIDYDGNSASADFTVIIPIMAKIDPTSGHVGTEVTASGSGYTSGKTITVKYDTTNVATTTVNADGTFSVTFEAPISLHGDHNVTITDGTTAKQFTFNMSSLPPPIPNPLLPEMGVKVKPPITFEWQDVSTDSPPVTYSLQIATRSSFAAGSIVLEKTELTEPEYAITETEQEELAKSKEAYYWRVRAVDSASNESLWTSPGTFYVGSAFPLPPWAIYTLIGLGGLILLLLVFWLGRRTAFAPSS